MQNRVASKLAHLSAVHLAMFQHPLANESGSSHVVKQSGFKRKWRSFSGRIDRLGQQSGMF